MTQKFKATLVVSALALAGCIDKTAYETTPVSVITDLGPITCQLYTKRQTFWDRATHVPQGMTIQQGDEICQQEGEKRR